MENLITEDSLKIGTLLLDRDIADTESFLGIQAERLALYQMRLEKGLSTPAWSDQDALEKVTSEQRSISDLLVYAEHGKTFIFTYLSQAEDALRARLCEGDQLHPDVKEVEKDIKDSLKEVSKILVGVLITNFPAGLIAAVSSLAAGLAVVLLKNKLAVFCKTGVAGIKDLK